MVSKIDKRIEVCFNAHKDRYLVFAFDYYDSYGGLSDCKGSFNSKQELLDILNEHFMYDSYQILDSKTGSTMFLTMKDFGGTLDLCDSICKVLFEIALEKNDKEINNLIRNYIGSFSEDDVQCIINNLKSYTVSFKNSGLIEPYLNLQILLGMLNDGDIYSFMKLLPNVIKCLENNKVSYSIIDYLKSLY